MRHILYQNRNCAGFFSDFTLNISALIYFYQNNIEDFTIIWNNRLYSDFELQDKYLFKQKYLNDYDVAHHIFTPLGLYWEPFNKQDNIIKGNLVLNKYGYMNNDVYLNIKNNNIIGNKKILGVQKRGTDHYLHGELLSLDYYFSQVELELKKDNYDNIYLITDENETLELFKQRYGNILYNQDVTRSNDNTAIHFMGTDNREKLIVDVMTDAINLSLCNKILITSSNVSLYTLLINPNINYLYIDKDIKYTI